MTSSNLTPGELLAKLGDLKKRSEREYSVPSQILTSSLGSLSWAWYLGLDLNPRKRWGPLPPAEVRARKTLRILRSRVKSGQRSGSKVRCSMRPRFFWEIKKKVRQELIKL